MIRRLDDVVVVVVVIVVFIFVASILNSYSYEGHHEAKGNRKQAQGKSKPFKMSEPVQHITIIGYPREKFT